MSKIGVDIYTSADGETSVLKIDLLTDDGESAGNLLTMPIGKYEDLCFGDNIAKYLGRG